ncbi:MAG: uracil-DNA glycosylase family protein [Akkermansiaceae bacterium]
MSEQLQRVAKRLISKLSGLRFSEPVTHTYNPLVYAWEPHQIYLERFGQGKKRVLFLGMNPGPWGMAQTGVPFGEISAVSDWMGISSLVAAPENEHPKRPIQGFGCPRSEVSGKRLWGLFSELYPNACDFFADHFVTNFCPLVWMGETGKNITPDKLSRSEMEPVDAACRWHLAQQINAMQPEFLIGVGAFAEKQFKATIKEYMPDYKGKIGRVLHPSPASPAANRGWAEAATKQLKEQGVW